MARRSALIGWARFAIALEVGVLILALAWVLSAWLGRSHGYLWAAPPVGLVVGAALPLQLVVISISRSGARP